MSSLGALIVCRLRQITVLVDITAIERVSANQYGIVGRVFKIVYISWLYFFL